MTVKRLKQERREEHEPCLTLHMSPNDASENEGVLQQQQANDMWLRLLPFTGSCWRYSREEQDDLGFTHCVAWPEIKRPCSSEVQPQKNPF